MWVSGRAPGTELALALRARRRWEEVAGGCPGSGFRANGSLTVACTPEELAVLEAVAARPDAGDAGWTCSSPRRPGAATRPWAAPGGPVLGALHCRLDAAVEPRAVLTALREAARAGGRYRWLPGREAVAAGDHQVVDATGARHRGDLVVLCPGAATGGLAAEVLDGAPLRRVRLQMLETAPYPGQVTTSLADGDSLRYYPAFDVPARRALAPQAPVAAAWAPSCCWSSASGALSPSATPTPPTSPSPSTSTRPLRATCSGWPGACWAPSRRRWCAAGPACTAS